MSKQLLIIILMLPASWSAQLPAHCQAAADASTATTPAAAPTKFLQGSVKHKEYLDPVPLGLRTGSTFDLQAQQAQSASANNWIPIPAWLAGTWQFKTENVTAMVNYTNINYTQPPYTIRNETQKIFGQQKDKTGQIWHYLKSPYSYTTKLNHGLVGYERVTAVEPISYNDSEVVLRVVGTDTQVNPRTKIVTTTDQSEDFNHYTEAGKDEMVNSGSAKHFDMNGQPTMDMTSAMLAKRIKPFEIIDQQDGNNLKQMFVDFLTSHGMPSLIP
jgi:hypothetical protein